METRTTLRLPRELLREARVKAVREGLSLSEVIRRLLRLWLGGRVEVEPFPLPQPDDRVRMAREAFGMWRDRDPDAYLRRSRTGLTTRDREIEDARLGV